MQSAGLFVLAAQLFDGTARYGQLFLTGGAFHGEEIAAHLYQRQTVFGQHGQRSHSPGRCQIKLFTPRLAGGFLGALLCKLHAGQAQLGTGVLQKLHSLAGGLHQGQLQFRLVDFGHDAREACACAHIHHAARHFRLAGKQQAVEEVLILDPLRVGDSGQVDLLVVVHQNFAATTVMVVGFVNSGMMKVAQAIGIIMGANIGTSITGWILCLSYIDGSSGIAQLLSTATISAIVAIIGIIFRTFIKKKPYSDIGDIMLGFAILMIGMQTMSGAVSPLKENPHFVRLLTMFTNPFMGILVGIVFTAVLQSASASVGILQALSITGSITFAAALPITMGIGVGAACPVLLSSIGTNKNGKRTALIYLLNDLFGMIFWSIVFYSANAIVHFPFMGEIMSPFRVALLNTVFRLLTILVLAPFIGKNEKLVFFLIKDTDEDNEEQADFDLLEERFLNYPPLAITQSQLAVNGMAKKAYKNIRRALALLKDFSDNKFNKIQEKENLIDKYEDKLGTYLMQLNMHDLTPEQSKQTAKFLHTISDFERLGDHAVNISRVAQELHEKSRIFSDAAKYELHVLESALKELLDLTINSFVDEDLVNAAKVEPLRELIGILCNDLKMRHIKRLRNGQCDLNTGFAFNDLLTNYDRIAAHCSNIAVAILELDSSNFDMHEYTKSVRKLKDNNYVSTFDYYEQKYNINGYQPEAEQDTKAAAKTPVKAVEAKK